MHADLGFSGFHSKEAILTAAFQHEGHAWLYYIALAGAAVTAFYMFRLWYMTFAGQPRDRHRFEHAHESPAVIVAPLVVLATLAVVAAWHVPFTGLSVEGLLQQATPEGAPSSSAEHAPHGLLSLVALTAELAGFVVATIFYGLRLADPAKVANNPLVRPIYLLLWHKWWFDELYRLVFIRPTLWVARLVAGTDRNIIDRFVDGLAATTRGVARVDDWLDRLLVDGLVNGLASWTYRTGISLRALQTGRLRQYVLTVAVGTVTLVVLLGLYWRLAIAGG